MLELDAHVEHRRTSGRDEQRLAQVDLIHQLGRDRERQDQEAHELENAANPVSPARSRHLARAGSILISPTSVASPALTETGIPRPKPGLW